MRVAITGGAGFIGSHLVDACREAGDEVTVVDDLSTGKRSLVTAVPLVELDVGSAAGPLAEAFSGVELVYHLAALRAVERSVDDPVATDAANTRGTLNVLVAAHSAGVRRVVSTSSSSVYGGADVLPTPESTPLSPRSPYAVSKVAGEHYARVWSEVYGLETVSLRPFNVFGPRQDPRSRYAAVIPSFIDAYLSGRAARIEGDGNQTRDFTFVSDVVTAFRLAAAADAAKVSGRSYNVGSNRPISLLELIEMISHLITSGVEPQFVAPRAGDVRHTWADINAAREDLRYEPQTPFEEGLAQSVEWLRSVRED